MNSKDISLSNPRNTVGEGEFLEGYYYRNLFIYLW